jgi:hypothetical protein
MMRKAPGLFLALVLTLSLALSACGGEGDSAKAAQHQALRAIPADASAVITLRPDILAADEDLKELLGEITGEGGGILGGVLGGVAPGSGETLNALLALKPSFVAIFVAGPGESGPPALDSNGDPIEDERTFFGLLAEGSFNKALLVPLIGVLTKSQPKATTYKGVDIYSLELEGRPISIAFLSDALLAVADAKTIVSIIDVHTGAKSAWHGRSLPFLDRQDDDFVKVAAGPVGEALARQGLETNAEMLGALGGIQDVTLGVSKSGENFTFHAKFRMASSQDALKMKKAVRGLRDILNLFGDDASRLFSRIEDSAQGRDYSLAIRYSYDDIEKLQGSLGEEE